MSDLTPLFEDHVRHAIEHIFEMGEDWDGEDPQVMRDVVSFAISDALRNGARLAVELTTQRGIRLESRIGQLENALSDIEGELCGVDVGECCISCQDDVARALRIARAALTPPGPHG